MQGHRENNNTDTSCDMSSQLGLTPTLLSILVLLDYKCTAHTLGDLRGDWQENTDEVEGNESLLS